MSGLPFGHPQTFARQPPYLLVHRDDRRELVLLSDRDFADDFKSDVPERSSRLVHLRRLRRIALKTQRQQVVRELRVSELVAPDQRQDAAEDRLTRSLRVL